MGKEKWFDCVSCEEAFILVKKLKSQGRSAYVVMTNGKIEVWVKETAIKILK
jgi:predicted RNA-binding protein YlxR (DUF448 family)